MTIKQASDILDAFNECGCNNPSHLADLINAYMGSESKQKLDLRGVYGDFEARWSLVIQGLLESVAAKINSQLPDIEVTL